MMWKFYAIGYGAPALIVFISVLVSETTGRHGYGTETQYVYTTLANAI